MPKVELMLVRVLAGLLIAASTVSQSATRGSGIVTIGTYSESQSRALFAGCDRNGDDRIDLFEALAAIQNITGRDGFRRIDSDRDGYLDWPEFDVWFQFIVKGGGSLRLQLANLPPKVTSVQADTAPRQPMQQAIAAFDQNQNGALESDELDALLREFRLPPAFGAQLRSFDHNHDGRIDESELAPVLSQLQLVAMFAPRATGKPVAAQRVAATTSLDADGDSLVTLEELTIALRRVDPALARWATVIAKAADRNGDGKLLISELTMPAEIRTAGAKGMAEQAVPR